MRLSCSVKMENVWLKEQCEELGLNYGAIDWASLTDAEFSALSCLRKGELVPDELKREILASKESKDVVTRRLMAEDIFNKLVEANIVNKNAETFDSIHNDVVKKLKFLPKENLNKLLSVSYKQNSTVSEWFQEMRKQGVFDFEPYLYKEEDVFFIVLAYDQYMSWSKEKKLQLVSTNGVISTDRDDVNNGIYDFIETMLRRMVGETSTELLQLLFYMSILNTGVFSRKFRDALLNGNENSSSSLGKDKIAKTLGEADLFSDFSFKFYDFVPYLMRYPAGDSYKHKYSDTEQWTWFRVPADNLDYDFCRIGIGSSLQTIMEYRNTENGNQELVRVNFEPALNKLDCLSTEEKEKILRDSNIGCAVVIFTLSLRQIIITKTDVYSIAPTESKLLSKSLKNLPILHDATELDYRVFEKFSNPQKSVQEGSVNEVNTSCLASSMPPTPPHSPAGLGMPSIPTPPHSPAGLGTPSIPTPPCRPRHVGMPPMQHR